MKSRWKGGGQMAFCALEAFMGWDAGQQKLVKPLTECIREGGTYGRDASGVPYIQSDKPIYIASLEGCRV